MTDQANDGTERAARLRKRRSELKDYLVQVAAGEKFQLSAHRQDASGEPLVMVKMMALTEEARALAEAEVRQRLKGLEAKMTDLGVALD